MACKWCRVCPLRRHETKGRMSSVWAEKYCKSEDGWKACIRYKLEEQGTYHPDNMLPDGTIDHTLS